MATFWFYRFLDWARRTPWLMVPTIITCLAVGGWGFYDYYGLQFEWIGLQHWYVFPFVPDCPLFVYLFAIVMIGMYLGKSNATFTGFVAVGNIKYGVWTVFVLLYYFERFFGGPGGDALFRSLILLLHVGMIPLGIVLWRSLPRLKTSDYAWILGGMLVYDYFDYFFTRAYQVYPIGLPNHGVYNPYTVQELGLVPWFTILESLVLVGGLWAHQRALYGHPAAAASPARPAPAPLEK